MWAILPIKSAANAKQRLRHVLNAAERQQLFAVMLQDVIAGITAAKSLDGLAIVSSDPLAVELAGRHNALLISETGDSGQSSAVDSGVRVLLARGIERIITIPADVPLISGEEIDRVCASLGEQAGVVIVPDRRSLGSNCIACSPPDALKFSFGEHSLARHLQSADERGVASKILRLANLGLDIDRPEDLLTLLDEPVGSRTREFLISSGIIRCIIPLYCEF